MIVVTNNQMSGWQNFGCMDLKQVRIILRQTKIRDKGNAQTNPMVIPLTKYFWKNG